VGYVIEKRGSLVDAAFRVSYDCSEKTIRLYVKRMRSRIEEWNAILLSYLLNILSGELPKNKIENPNMSINQKNWDLFLNISERIVSREESLPEFQIHTNKYGYLLAIIQRTHPALGP
jgi:hypothetical protein